MADPDRLGGLNLSPENVDEAPVERSHFFSAPTIPPAGGRWTFLRRTRTPFSNRSTASSESIRGLHGLTQINNPAEPRVDFIFVHGLHGGSRKTWSLHPEDLESFWPGWLRFESGFRHVRVHSFGYDSDWTKKQQSVLTLHDFAQALLSDIRNSVVLRKNGKTPIVFVAHSMGGLVVKKAFLLGTRDPLYQATVARVHTMYFLGTPHQGSDSAIYLKVALSMPLPTGSKAYVNDLLPDCPTVQSINDEFRHVCDKVELWSFWEAKPTAGFWIVPKSKAVMNLPRERKRYLSADHRHICKFENLEDPNYNILRQSFLVTIEETQKDYAVQQQECYIEQMKSIATAFGAPQKPENELLDLLAKQHKGTCKWLTDNDQFERWLFCDTELVKSLAVDINPADVCPRFIWLNGLPGSGKSVATAHVIRYLESLNRNCSYFFFRNNDTARVTALLLNLAYQMAASNLEVRHVLVSMIEMSEVTDIQDHTIIWNNIFLSRIFNVAFTEPHFWVIDALDECNINSLRALIPMLAKIDSKLPLKIFVSSRYDDHVERLFKQERVEVTELHTSQEGSLKDIDTYIRSRERLVSGGNGEKMFEDILQRSNGNFLWTHLTVNILDDLFSVEQMRNALNGVPSEMKGLFKDILEKIANGASADLARCMLTWAICTPAPLTADELREAVRLDIKHTIVASVSVSQICKSLITVDRDSRIQLMHQTVKEFLTSADSDFYINVRQAHERLATVCLTHLSGPNFLSVTRRRPHIATASAGEVFDRYASANFSYHLAHSHSTSRELMTLLTKLINNNILTWIERVAVMGTLTPFFHAIQNLGRYLSRQLDTTAPFDSEYQTVSELITDLTHIASVFGLSLLDSPSCIFTLIPPLCPTSSIIQRTFAARSRHKLICSSNQTWDARLSCLAFPSSTKTMAANNKYHVVGLANGNIRIFNTSSLEEVATLSHGQPVRHLAFGNVSNMLASCSVRTLTLWDSTLKRMWSRQLPERPTVAFAVYFSSDDTRLLVCVKGNVNKAVCVYRAEDGCEMTSISLNDSGSSSDSDSDEGALRERFIPDVLRLSPILGYAVIAYRSTLPKIYRLEPDDTLEEICVFSKDGRNPSAGMYSQVLDVAFCPAIELGLMAISYQDGEIVTVQFDQWQAHKENMYLLHARILAASPDGNTLAAGDNDGGVVLFDFDTLRPLQRVATLDDVVAGILFGHNSLRLYDVRGTVCNVWEPTVLVRKGSADDSSTGPEEQQADPFEPKQFDEVKTITAITQAGSDHFVFCGREDGTITVHDINTGRILLELELHAAIIHHLEWSSHRNCLLSVDAAGKCKLTQLSAPPSGPWSMKENTLEHRANSTVIQALLHHERLTVLLSTRDGEELLEDGRVLVSSFSFGAARWIYHPIQQESLLHVDGDKIHLHSWNGLRRETGEAGVHVKLPDEVDLPLTNEWVHRMGMDMLVQAVQVHTHTKTGFLALSPSEVQSDSTSVAVSSLIRRLLSGVKVVLGIHGSNIYFLSHRGWICSLSTKSLPDPRHYTRHFFIPSFWQTGREPLIKIVSRHSVAFAYRDELIVFHQFLDNEFKISFDEVP